MRAQAAIEKARELEERLLGLAHPTEAEIVSPGDDDTPVWHLLTMAEVYRCTGLMQLYRVFPDLLRSRLPNPNATTSTTHDPFFPIDLDSMNLPARFGDIGSSNAPNNSSNPNHHAHSSPSSLPAASNVYTRHHHPQNTSNQDQNPDTDPDTLYDNWLTEFAVTTLSRLKTIPLESRTRCLQPLLLVASSSELRLPQLSETPHATTTHSQSRKPSHAHTNNANEPGDPSNNEFYDNDPDSNKSGPGSGTETPTVSMEAIEVSRTRRFILGRLTSFLHVLPPKPINVCLRLVKEVWRRMDAGETDSYWVDVMIEKGWQTTMG